MTYIARVENAFDGLVYLIIEKDRRLSKIKIPGRPEIIKSALSTYRDLKYRPAKDVPKSIRNLDLENKVDFTA